MGLADALALAGSPNSGTKLWLRPRSPIAKYRYPGEPRRPIQEHFLRMHLCRLFIGFCCVELAVFAAYVFGVDTVYDFALLYQYYGTCAVASVPEACVALFSSGSFVANKQHFRFFAADIGYHLAAC